MRKTIALAVTLCLLVSSLISPAYGDSIFKANGVKADPAVIQTAAQGTYVPEAGNISSYVLETKDYIQYGFKPPSSEWYNRISGEVPASFSTFSYTLQDNVIKVTPDVTDNISTGPMLLEGDPSKSISTRYAVAQGGYIPMNVLDDAAIQSGQDIEIGSIIVDESTGTAFKVVAPTSFDGLSQISNGSEGISELLKISEALEGTYGVASPQLHEVIKDFSIGGTDGQAETIQLNRGNITGFAPHMEENLVETSVIQPLSLKDQFMGFEQINDPMLKFVFDDDTVDAWLDDGTKIEVNLTGGIAISKMDLTARYSGFSGYEISLSVAEESYLYVDMKASGNQTVKILLQALVWTSV